MNVLDIMTANPTIIMLSSTLRDTLQLMESQSIKHLPVISRDGHLVGVISDRDCRLALNSPQLSEYDWRRNTAADQLLVRDMMSPAPIIVEPHAPAAEAARLMLTHHIGCLPVMRSETLVGIITRSDILVAFMTVHRRMEIISSDFENHIAVKSEKSK